MPNMIFRGAWIRYFDVRMSEGGQFVRIHLTANFSKPVCEAMDWDPDLPKAIESAKLEGRKSATNLILTPNGDLAKHEIQFAVNDISDFSVHRVAEEGKESKRTELRFTARSPERIAKYLEEYLAKIGEGQGQLKVSYEHQEDLPLQTDKQEEPAEDSEEQPSTGTLARKGAMKKGELEPVH